jgi:hypothetical protein
MPKTDTPSAESIAFHVPAPLLKEAEEMAQLEGWKLAEFHRLCWEAGLAIQAEKSNKRLVNKGLRAKQTNIEVTGVSINQNDYITAEQFKEGLRRAGRTSLIDITPTPDSSEPQQP